MITVYVFANAPPPVRSATRGLWALEEPWAKEARCEARAAWRKVLRAPAAPRGVRRMEEVP